MRLAQFNKGKKLSIFGSNVFYTCKVDDVPFWYNFLTERNKYSNYEMCGISSTILIGLLSFTRTFGDIITQSTTFRLHW